MLGRKLLPPIVEDKKKAPLSVSSDDSNSPVAFESFNTWIKRKRKQNLNSALRRRRSKSEGDAGSPIYDISIDASTYRYL